MQYSQEHLKTMVYAEFGGQTECIMGNWKIENGWSNASFNKKHGNCFFLTLQTYLNLTNLYGKRLI